MRVLLAGAAGFIGSHLAERLIDEGAHVVALDSFVTGQRANLDRLVGHPAFELVEADVADAPDIESDLIMHLASPASPIDYDRLPLETMRSNALGTWRLLDLARTTGARFVFTSTSEVYGDPLVHPQPEEYWGNVDPIGPRSCYDESKRFAEALIMANRRMHGQRAAVVRLFNTYGPRMRLDDGRAIPELMTAALEDRPLVVHGDGQQTRSFCYVSDLVDALVAVGLDDDADGVVLNIGNPAEMSILDLATTIVEVTGSRSEIVFDTRRQGDPERRRPDITRVTARYGWRPRVELAEGLERTAEAFRAELGYRSMPADAALA